MHRLFADQLRSAADASGKVDIDKLAKLVSATYEEYGRDKRRTAHSIELMLQRLEQAHSRLLQALDVIPEGLAIFDAEDRYVLWNRQYAELYAESADLIRVGARFEDVLRTGLARGQYREAIGREEEWLAARLAQHSLPSSTREQNLAGDRWIRIDERRTPEGGSVGIRVDISELKQREAAYRRVEVELRRTREFLDTIIENIPIAVFAKDAADLRYVLLNRAAESYYGMPRERMLGKTPNQIFSPEVGKAITEQDRQVVGSRTPQYLEDRLLEASVRGQDRIVNSRKLLISDADGEPQYLIGVIEDVTERRATQDRIAYLACHDALTGLPNRSALRENLQERLELAQSNAASLALLRLDLDRFREVNDVFGNPAGDKLMCAVADRLVAEADGLFVSRIGGDEFVVLMNDDAPRERVAQLADRLVEAIGSELEFGDNLLSVGLSIGVAIYPHDGNDVDTLLANADSALSRAKREGRARARFFDAMMDKELRDRRLLQQDLCHALEKQQLLLHFQPLAKVDGEIVGFEALLRWRHPTRGFVAPDIFIPLAEETGLIMQIGEWVLREACHEAAGWPDHLRLAVNLSPCQFRTGDLEKTVHQILLEAGLAPTRLEIEITEGVLIADHSRALMLLRRLKALGISVAMDDFGTGYSSLSYLQSFPFDKIKIDRSFISNLEKRAESVAIVQAILSLARALQIPVIAEGVETERQRQFLAKEACQEIQGYLIGRPGTIDQYVHVVSLSGCARNGASQVLYEVGAA